MIYEKYFRNKLSRQKARIGFLFSLPTIFGIIFLFCLPLLQSLRMAFSSISVKRGTGLVFKFAWLDNFKYAFTQHADFTRSLTVALLSMAQTVPVILFVSFFCALLINQKFPGRWLVRVIFFLPIIYASSAMLKVDSGDVMQQAMQNSSYKSVEASTGFLQSFELSDFIGQFGLPDTFTGALASIVDRVYEMISLSGVQILIILAALQSISPALYEAAHVEGAGGWEKFWLITFPMTGGPVLLCLIYSIIDSFVAYNNPIVVLTQQLMSDMKYGHSAAMSWVYFAVVALILGIVGAVGSRLVFSYDRR